MHTHQHSGSLKYRDDRVHMYEHLNPLLGGVHTYERMERAPCAVRLVWREISLFVAFVTGFHVAHEVQAFLSIRKLLADGCEESFKRIRKRFLL